MGFVSFSGKSNDVSDHDQTGDVTNDLSTAGKVHQLSSTASASAKNLSPHVTNCKRNSMVLTNFHHQTDFKKSNHKCNCTSIPLQTKRSANERMNVKDACDADSCTRMESFSCDSISKSTFQTPTGNCSHMQALQSDDNIKLTTIECNASGNIIDMPKTTSGAISPIISLSKSETNISETNAEENRNQLTVYNVVSLNNLHDSEPFFHRTLNDHAKNQCLANSSENDLFNLSPKKHIVTLTNPKVLTTVTVSMRNAADVSDKVF